MIRHMLSAIQFGLGVLVVFLAVRLVGPFVERSIYPPLIDLEITSIECDKNLVGGWVDKTQYFGGQAAVIVALNVYDGSGNGDLLLGLNESQLRNRSAGFQAFSVELTDGCAESVVLLIKHRSPITGLIIPTTWGPFAPGTEGAGE